MNSIRQFNPAAVAGIALALLVAALPVVASDLQQQMVASNASAVPRQGGGYAVGHSSISSGGGTSTGGIYAIAGSVGQANADPLGPASGGIYAVTGGYWAGAPLPSTVFVNGFEGF
jgi:hypothetical protein